MSTTIVLDSVARIPKALLRPDDIVSIEETLSVEEDEGDFGFGGGEKKLVKFYEETETHYLVPRQWGVFRYGTRFPMEKRFADGASARVEFRGEFRPGQEGFVTELCEGAIRDGMGAIGKAKPGFGKTVCAAAVIATLGRATLVIVPKKILVGQWVNRMEKYLGVTPGVVLLEKNLCEWEGKPVVVALANSLAARDYGEEFYKYFGVVIADEVHRGASPTWWRAIKSFPARYRIGLTATPRRGDGMFRAIKWQVGDIVTEGVSKSLACEVDILTWPRSIPKRKFFWNKKPVMARFWKHVTRSEGFAEWVCEKAIIPELLKGRQVLVLADLLELLERMHDYVNDQLDFPTKAKFTGTGYLVGSSTKTKKGQKKLTPADETTAKKLAGLFGTWIFVSEGFDVETMSVLVMATGRSDVEQAVGRIQRLSSGKPTPIVKDIRFKAGWAIERYEEKRDRFYEEQGFKVFED